MILQALCRYYNILLKDPDTEISPFGYSRVGISFALDISADGELLDIIPLFEQVQRGRSTREVPRQMIVPAQIKRAANIAPNFMWDNAVYVLGLSEKRDKYRSDRFNAFREHNIGLLAPIDSDVARAAITFLEKHDLMMMEELPAVAEKRDELLKGGNLIFLFEGNYAHKDPLIRHAWESFLATQDQEQMQCLITGEIAPVERLHSSLKGIRGGQPTGTTLVGFNASAYESYNRTQGQNSPVSKKAAFAYTTALNYLLSDANPNRKIFLGDTTVVYWAESTNRIYETTFASIFDPTFDDEADPQTDRRRIEAELKAVADNIRQAQPVDIDALFENLGDEDPRFYILGLAPNAARVSVRFFITDPFSKIVRNIMAHYQDLAIVKTWENQPDYIRVRDIVNETVSKKSQDRDASPLLTGAVFRAVLTNTPYPAALYYALINRVRAEPENSINYVRAAAIKAYLLRKYRYQSQHPFQEVLTMALNKQSTNPAYLLGRLFAVLEAAQNDAIPNAKATIKDRYFTSACASPASVFPILLRLSQHHIAKAEYGYYRERQIEDILNRLDMEQNPIPSRLTLDDQGVFILGYYHQRADLYTKRTEKSDEEIADVVIEVDD